MRSILYRHRYRAYLKCGIGLISCDVRAGTLDDAKAFACEANKEHSLPRSNIDKRNALREYLKIPGKSELSNSEIGKRIGVSNHLVQTLREELDLQPSPKACVGGGGKAAIGKFQSKTKEGKPSAAKTKGLFTTLYNVSTDSPEQFVSILRIEFDRPYLDSLLTHLQQSLTIAD